MTTYDFSTTLFIADSIGEGFDGPPYYLAEQLYTQMLGWA